MSLSKEKSAKRKAEKTCDARGLHVAVFVSFDACASVYGQCGVVDSACVGVDAGVWLPRTEQDCAKVWSGGWWEATECARLCAS